MTITTTADYDLLLPLLLTLDPAKYVQGAPQGAAEQTSDGRWLISLANNVPGGVRLAPGQSTSGLTGHVGTPGFETADYEPGVVGVPNDNALPVFQSAPPVNVTAGQTHTLTSPSSRPDSAAPWVAYLLQRAPQGMTVDPATGVITWATSAQSPADAAVTLYAFDSRGAWTKQQWTVHDAGGNAPPVFGPLPTTLQITEGQAWQVPVTATDADGDPLVYWADNLPPFATFDPATHTFAWTPALGEAGTYHGVTIYVSDGTTTVSQTFDVLVARANHPPTLALPPDRTVLQGDGFVLKFAGNDPDGGKVTYSSSNLPEGAVLDANTGRFQWTVPYDVSGPGAVPVTVTSSTGLTVTKTITFTVLVAPAVPVFDPQPGWAVNEGQSLTFTTHATDPHNPGFQLPKRNPDGTLNPPNVVSPITYAVAGLPRGASYDPQTATFSCRCRITHRPASTASPSRPPTAATTLRPSRRKSLSRSACMSSIGRRRLRRSPMSASTAGRSSTCR